MNLQASTLADRVSDFFKNSFDYMKYAAATAAGAAVIALSSAVAAQAPAPAAPSPVPAAAPGTVVFEKVDPATGAVSGVFEAKDYVFELTPGVYVARSKDARNSTPLVDINGDGVTDLDSAFEFSSGWQGTVRVRKQYTGAEWITPEVRQSMEQEGTYIVRVAQPAAGAPAAGTAPPAAPPGAAPKTEIVGTTPRAPEGASVPPLLPPSVPPPVAPVPPPVAPPPAEVPLTLLDKINAEAAGMFARLGPHLAISVAPGYGILSLNQTFEENGYEARSSAIGPRLAGSIGGIIGEGNGLAVRVEGDYAQISNGNGTVMQRGNNVGEFTYDGSWRTMAAEAAYVRLLNDNRSEPEQSATRRNAYVGMRAERATANVSGTNVTANEQTTDILLAVAGINDAVAYIDGVDHAVSVRLAAGVNDQSNSNGIDYDAGFSARIAAEYLARFGPMGLTAGAEGGYNTMSTGTHGQKQERDELSLALRGGVAYLWGGERQHRVGLDIAHRTTLADNQANDRSQLSETTQDTRAQIIADLAF